METTYPEKCERYIQNLRRVRALSKPQFAPETAPEALLEEIQDNAVSSFGLMQENNALLNELVYVLDPKTLTDEEITNLEAFAGRLFNFGNSEDCGVAYKIHSLLLEAARFREDDRMIVKELYTTASPCITSTSGTTTMGSICWNPASMHTLWKRPAISAGTRRWTPRRGNTSSAASATSV